MKRSRKSSNKPPRVKAPPRGVVDRLAWIQAQLARVDALAIEAGTRDIQGVGRLLGEMRQLRDMLDAELETRRQADSGGTAAQLEAKLVEALAAIDEERLARVLRGAAATRGIGDVGEWLAGRTA